MKIVGLQARAVPLPLEIPYRIAYETVSATSNVLLTVEDEEGLRGFGCAAPDEAVTGETTSGVLAVVEAEVVSRVVGADASRPRLLLEELRPALVGNPSARAAVDMALWDLLARRAGMPLWRLLGGYRSSIPTSVTIGILDLEATVGRAEALVADGFFILKLKGGDDIECDIERVLAVRRAVGPRVELRFDANQGYTVEESLRLVEATREADLEILEQPTPRSRFELLGRVTEAAYLPVMADESLMTLQDALRLGEDGQADLLNVKLMKCGGLDPAMRIAAVARATGIEIMVGCMDEMALGIAAGLAFALSTPQVVYADLDGHLDLLEDPTAGCVTLRDGVLYPSEAPGLGFDEPRGGRRQPEDAATPG